MDEAAEAAEQETLARREQAMLDMAAAAAEEQNRTAAAETQDEEMEGERDLDDDVPEAEASDSDSSGSEEENSDIEEGDTSGLQGHPGEMTFNEDSFIEGSMMHADVEHMLEMEEAEMAGVLQDERDLDEDIPEAGSYEHTDTELDDSSDEGDNSRLSGAPSVNRRRSGRRSSGLPSMGVGAMSAPRARGSIQYTESNSFGFDGGSSILDGSSFLRSSPAVAARGSLRSRFMGARAPRGG